MTCPRVLKAEHQIVVATTCVRPRYTLGVAADASGGRRIGSPFFRTYTDLWGAQDRVLGHYNGDWHEGDAEVARNVSRLSRAERDFAVEQSRKGAPVMNTKRGLMRLCSLPASDGWS